jgi:hypothetical protein
LKHVNCKFTLENDLPTQIQKKGDDFMKKLNNARVSPIEPPGIINDETIDTVIDRLDKKLAEVTKEFRAS